MTKTKAGRFYERTPGGPGDWHEVDGAHGRRPDVWICRRVADYAPAPIPALGARATCADCGAAIIYNPARDASVPAGTPKVCMQCAGIEPLPIES